MKKTIKINDDYKISWKLIYDKENNKWYIEILDDWKWIEKTLDYENFDDLDKAIDELKHRIKRNINYKLWFSIMNYYYKKWYDLQKARNNVYEINNDFKNLDNMYLDRLSFIKNHNIKIVNHI